MHDDKLKKRLGALPAWEIREGRLCREFVFANFAEAFAFMTAMAEVAERMNHHPEWTNAYNKVEVSLVTHDTGGISEKDFELAEAMDKAAAGKIKRAAP